MATQPRPFLTPEQYLAIEREAEFRSEYFNGEMFAMAGASPSHNIIVNNIGRSLHPQIKGRGRYLTSEVRLLVPATGLYTYPDLMVICGPIEYAGDRGDIVTNPRVTVEVLSPSTATYDRGNKSVHYRSIPTLAEYLTVAQDQVRVEHSTLRADGSWLIRTYTSPDDVIRIESIAADIRLAEAYEAI